MDAWSWCSLLASGSTLDFNFFIFSFFSALYSSSSVGSTLNIFFKVLCWSLNCLFLGTWPSEDHTGTPYPAGTLAHKRAGQPLANGFFAVLMCVKGDLDYYGKVLKLPWYSSLSPCAFCPCNTTTMPWNDFGASAAWRSNVWNNVTWAAARPARHQLFLGEFSCGILSVCADLLHTKHLGTDAWFYGSVLHMLCYMVLPDSPEANLNEVWTFLHRYFQERGWGGLCQHALGSDKTMWMLGSLGHPE